MLSLQDLAPSCPKFVATQAPLTITILDFWTMVYELGSEVVVQMTSEYEANAVGMFVVLVLWSGIESDFQCLCVVHGRRPIDAGTICRHTCPVR